VKRGIARQKRANSQLSNPTPANHLGSLPPALLALIQSGLSAKHEMEGGPFLPPAPVLARAAAAEEVKSGKGRKEALRREKCRMEPWESPMRRVEVRLKDWLWIEGAS
jgi:hypothetical protein